MVIYTFLIVAYQEDRWSLHVMQLVVAGVWFGHRVVRTQLDRVSSGSRKHWFEDIIIYYENTTVV